MESESCYLKDYMNCSYSGGGGFVGVKRLRTSSLIRGDNLHEQLSHEPDAKYWCHKNCISSYTSKSHIKCHVSKNSNTDAPPVKRSRRSEQHTFSFKDECIFCGKACEELDPRHPDRWRSVSKCRTADRGSSQKTFKDAILDTCDHRDDEWGNQVRLRIQAAVSDLHAADAQYHRDCLQSFKCNISNAQNEADRSDDGSFVKVVDCMLADKSRVWNAVEVAALYVSHGGELLSRRLLIQRLSDTLGPDLLILSGDGVANILVFRNQASKHMKLVANDEDDIDTAIGRVTKVIIRESRELKRDQSTYSTRIRLDDALDSSSPTLLNLLSRLSPKLQSNLPAAMVGNMVTCAVTNKPTFVQIALGVVIRVKAIIELLHDFGITSTYDEILRFKSSAAHAAAKSKEKLGIFHNDAGLVQVVADNFDANISSANGVKSTHALAILLTQPQQPRDQMNTSEGNKIKRLKKTEMSENVIPDVPIHHYEGPKRPDMPDSAATHSPLPLRILASQRISVDRARETDFQFLADIVSVPNTPEFGGYNTLRARDQDHATKAKTKAVYLPLIDMTPAEPTTMLTAMVEAQQLTNSTGQTYTIFTNDQQLYRIVVNITWVYDALFQNFIPRLGGMHTIMSFVGAIGTLMADTGLEEIMSVAFGGVSKMLIGKKYPQNIRALRIVVEELLRGMITTGKFETYSQLVKALEDQASHSRTTKLWVNNLIKPVLIMMLFIRAEREADWPLHLFATQMMMPYFFYSGHFNYARYCLYYLHSMTKLPSPVQDEFMKGNHVMRHQSGIWNGLWSDLYIESTFMRYGHSPGGIIGITLQPSSLKRWALSLHICAQLKKDVMSLADDDVQSTVTTHKEEGASRIVTDATDRENIRNKLVTCIDPLNPASHSPGNLINIVSGRISPASVNVDDSVQLGEQLMRSYEEGWPQSFHKPLTKPTVTMSVTRKQVNVGGVGVFDTSLIYSRVLCLQKVRDIDMKDVLEYELSGVPTSIFDETGEMRITKSKSTLKTNLQVELTDRRSIPPDAIVLDGCAILWVINWPAHGLVQDYVKNVVDYVTRHLQIADTYLIFDRYYENSIKEATRTSRAGKNASRQHQLSMSTPLPPQKVVLTVTHNKLQLIKHICAFLRERRQDLLPHNRKLLVVTGPEPTPVEICDGGMRERSDLRTTHEEADVIIIQQVVHLANSGKLSIRVVADDTDVFVLLLHYYKVMQLTCNLVMIGTSSGRKCVDIKATVEKHGDIIDHILPAHVLSGCDTISSLWGIGKGIVLKVLRSGKKSLIKLGNTHEHLNDVMSQSTAFIASCYGLPKESDMTSLRYMVWTNKMSNHKLNSAPKLRVLPPTKEAFREHVSRAHLQAAIWRCALDAVPPDLNPVHHGWSLNADTNKLEPIALPADVSPAPASVLKMIKCGCSSSQPCSTARCSCSTAHISCSVFCACHGDEYCRNQHTITAVREEYDDDDGADAGVPGDVLDAMDND